MPKSYAEQLNKKKKDEEKIVGQQQKTQPAANKPIGSTSIPKSRTQSSAASSSRAKNLDTSGRAKNAKEQARQDRARKTVERNPSARNYTNDTRTRRSELRTTKQRNEDERKEKRLNLPGYSAGQYGKNSNWTPTRQKMAEVAQSNTRNNINNYSLGNGQTIGGGTISRIPDASNLPMIGGVNQINDLDKYKINGQFDLNAETIGNEENNTLPYAHYEPIARNGIKWDRDDGTGELTISGKEFVGSDNKRLTKEDIRKGVDNLTPEIMQEWLSPEYKLDKDARKIAKLYAQQELSKYTSGAGGVPQIGTPEEREDYANLRSLANKTSPLASFAQGFIDPYAKVGRLARDVVSAPFASEEDKEWNRKSDELWEMANQNAQKQNPNLNAAGELAGNATEYALTEPVVNAVAGLIGVTSKFGKFVVNQAVNLMQDGVLDIGPLINDLSKRNDLTEEQKVAQIANAIRNDALGNVFGYGLSNAVGKLGKTASESAIEAAEQTAKNAVPEITQQASKDFTNPFGDLADEIINPGVADNVAPEIDGLGSYVVRNTPQAPQNTIKNNGFLNILRDNEYAKLADMGADKGPLNDSLGKIVQAVDSADRNAYDAAITEFKQLADAEGINFDRVITRLNRYIDGNVSEDLDTELINSITHNIDTIDAELKKLDAIGVPPTKNGTDWLANAHKALDDYESAVFDNGDVTEATETLNKALGNLNNQAKKLDAYDGAFSAWKGGGTPRGDLYSNSSRIPGYGRTDWTDDMIEELNEYSNQNRFARPANQAENAIPNNETLPEANVNVPTAGETPKSETERLWEELSGGNEASKTISESNDIPQPEGGAAEPKIRQGRTNVFERSGITEEESKNIFKPEDYSYVPDTNPDQLVRGAEIANSPDFKAKYIDNFDPESRYSVDEIDAMMMQSRKYRDLAREATDPIEKQKNYALSKQLSMNSVKAVGDNAASLQGWQKWVNTPEHVVDKGYGVITDITEKYLKNNKKAAYGIRDVANKINKAMMDKGYADIIDSGDATKIAQLKNDLSNTIDEILGKVDKNTRKALEGMTEAEIDDLIYNRSVNEINRALEFHAATGSMGIKDSTLDEIYDIMAKNESLNPNSKEFVKNEQKIYSLIANDITHGKPFKEKLDAWRYMSMLSSPATHLRNISGNLTMRGLAGVKNNLAAIIEAGADRKHGIDRTKSVLGVGDRELVESAKKDALEHSYRALSGNMYTGMKAGIEDNINAFDDRKAVGRALNKANDSISGSLSAEDEFAKINTYSTALAGYLKANGFDKSILSPDDALSAKNIDQLEKVFSKGTKRLEYPTITDSPEKMWSQFMEDARAYAVKQAKVQTFNNTNEFAAPFSRFTKELRGSDKAAVRGIGLAMDVTVPFKNVPANVLQTAFAYSPAEFIKVASDISKLKKGAISAPEFIDDIAKATTGTIGMIIGGLLARQGILRVSAGKGTKEKNFDKATDAMNDSISINGHSMKLTQLFPSAAPLIFGATAYEAYANKDTEDGAINTLVDGLGAIADGVVDMTMLQGISELFDAVKYAEDEKSKAAALGTQIGSNLAGQFVPTLGGLIEKGLDSTSRETYYTENSGIAQKATQAAKYNLTKLPGSQKLGETLEKSSNSTISSLGDYMSLEPRIDSKGNVVEQKGGNAAGRLFRGTFPFELGEDRSTEIDNKLRDLAYSFAAGEARDNVFPYTATSESKFKNSADENVKLTEKQWTAYKQAKGHMTDAMIQEFLGGTYDSLSNTAKADVLADLYNFAKKYNQNAIGDGKLEGDMAKMAKVYDTEGIAGVVRNYAMKYMSDEDKTKALDNLDEQEKQNAYQTMFGSTQKAQAVYDRAMNIVGPDSLQTAYDYYKATDLDGNGYIKKEEATEFLNSQKDLTNDQRADYWDVLTGGKNNPFREAGKEADTGIPEVKSNKKPVSTAKNNLAASAANINKKEALRQKNAQPTENTTQESVPDLGWSVSNGSKNYDLHDTKGYQRATAAGISDDEWLNAYWAANTNKDTKITKGEAEAYIKALGDISQTEKRNWFDYLIGTRAKNPY